MEKKSNKLYFGDEVDAAIIAFNSSGIPDRERSALFQKVIYPALTQLVQNVIYDAIKRERPYYTDLPYEDLKHECIVFLYEKLQGFDPERGRAFSYFNHITIKWMIGHSQVAYAKLKTQCDVEAIDTSRDLPFESASEDSIQMRRDFIRAWARYCNSKLDVLFKKKRDRRIANAIFNLFENSEWIDIYKKKALYLLIREQVDVSTHHITTVLSEIRNLYNNMYRAWLNKGGNLS